MNLTPSTTPGLCWVMTLAAFALLLIIPLAATHAADAPTKPERIALWPDQAPIGEGKFAPGPANAFITLHRPAKPNGTALIICPGGAYGGLMVNPEGHGIAQWLNQHGITGIVLEYRLPHGNPYLPMLDAQRALRLVRFHAQDYGCDPKRIGIIGFSAGGHVASTAATHFDNGDPKAADPIDRVSCRPDFAVLIYPVITMGRLTHAGSKTNLLGKDPTPEMVKLFSNEEQVTDQTPPTYLAHAKNDSAVPPANSADFYAALQAHKVAGEYLELPTGGHGLNHYQGPMWDAWQAGSLKWMTGLGIIPKEESAEKSGEKGTNEAAH